MESSTAEFLIAVDAFAQTPTGVSAHKFGDSEYIIIHMQQQQQQQEQRPKL